MIHQDKILKLTIFLVSLYLTGHFFSLNEGFLTSSYYYCKLTTVLFVIFITRRPSHSYGTSQRSSQFNHSGKQIWDFCSLCIWRYFASTRGRYSATNGPKNRKFRFRGTRLSRKELFPALLKGLTDVSDKIFPFSTSFCFPQTLRDDMKISVRTELDKSFEKFVHLENYLL